MSRKPQGRGELPGEEVPEVGAAGEVHEAGGGRPRRVEGIVVPGAGGEPDLDHAGAGFLQDVGPLVEEVLLREGALPGHVGDADDVPDIGGPGGFLGAGEQGEDQKIHRARILDDKGFRC
jgi:hypothetical protein